MSEAVLTLTILSLGSFNTHTVCCEMTLSRPFGILVHVSNVTKCDIYESIKTLRLPKGRPDMSSEHFPTDKNEHFKSVSFVGVCSAHIMGTFIFATRTHFNFRCYHTVHYTGKFSDSVENKLSNTA